MDIEGFFKLNTNGSFRGHLGQFWVDIILIIMEVG